MPWSAAPCLVWSCWRGNESELRGRVQTLEKSLHQLQTESSAWQNQDVRLQLVEHSLQHLPPMALAHLSAQGTVKILHPAAEDLATRVETLEKPFSNGEQAKYLEGYCGSLTARVETLEKSLKHLTGHVGCSEMPQSPNKRLKLRTRASAWHPCPPGADCYPRPCQLLCQARPFCTGELQDTHMCASTATDLSL